MCIHKNAIEKVRHYARISSVYVLILNLEDFHYVQAVQMYSWNGDWKIRAALVMDVGHISAVI